MIQSTREVNLLRVTARNIIRAYWKASSEEQLSEVCNRMNRLCGWLYETLENEAASTEVLNKCSDLLSWIHTQMTENN